MSQIMNHREIEHYAKQYWNAKHIDETTRNEIFQDVMQKANKSNLKENNLTPEKLLNWMDQTYEEVGQEDLIMDYGIDCIRCYLLFEKTPVKNDPYFDSWDEGALEGVYKFVSKYRRMILTALEANHQGKYYDTDVTFLSAKVEQMKQEGLSYMWKENTMPNRHNVISVFMEGFKNIQKELHINEFTVKEHEHEIETAVPHGDYAEDFRQNHTMENKTMPSKEENLKQMDDIMINETIGSDSCNPDIFTLCRRMVTMMVPFVPYISEELWQAIQIYESAQQANTVQLTDWYSRTQESTSALQQKWTVEDITRTEENVISIPVQINAKTKRIIQIHDGVTEEQVEELAKNEIQKFLKSGAKYRMIYVKNKLVNFVEQN